MNVVFLTVFLIISSFLDEKLILTCGEKVCYIRSNLACWFMIVYAGRELLFPNLIIS
jgi:hypothetical protein